jgi:hypothetical protein
MILFGTTAGGPLVWKFEFELLEFIWARPGATYLLYTLIRFGASGGGNKYLRRYFGLGQEFGFRCLEFSESIKRVFFEQSDNQ